LVFSTKTLIVLGISFGVFLILTVVLIKVMKPFIARLPADYFTNRTRAKSRKGSVAAKILRNIGAVLLLIAGIALSLPGVPGPGVLLILVALILGDFPKKFEMMAWLASRGMINKWLNKTRAKYGKPAFEV
jgi:UPF0716 family protein affecting phage T7 exclusion